MTHNGAPRNREVSELFAGSMKEGFGPGAGFQGDIISAQVWRLHSVGSAANNPNCMGSHLFYPEIKAEAHAESQSLLKPCLGQKNTSLGALKYSSLVAWVEWFPIITWHRLPVAKSGAPGTPTGFMTRNYTTGVDTALEDPATYKTVEEILGDESYTRI